VALFLWVSLPDVLNNRGVFVFVVMKTDRENENINQHGVTFRRTLAILL
jgi:hypothetical protein